MPSLVSSESAPVPEPEPEPELEPEPEPDEPDEPDEPEPVHRADDDLECGFEAQPTAAEPENDDSLTVEVVPVDQKLTVKELRERCEAMGLPTTGKKADLMSRLSEFKTG
tara:strand:- start:1942 stop:2271 length:330 start_codon:yes stop_codon:yes gene_type:complete